MRICWLFRGCFILGRSEEGLFGRGVLGLLDGGVAMGSIYYEISSCPIAKITMLFYPAMSLETGQISGSSNSTYSLNSFSIMILYSLQCSSSVNNTFASVKASIMKSLHQGRCLRP